MAPIAGHERLAQTPPGWWACQERVQGFAFCWRSSQAAGHLLLILDKRTGGCAHLAAGSVSGRCVVPPARLTRWERAASRSRGNMCAATGARVHLSPCGSVCLSALNQLSGPCINFTQRLACYAGSPWHGMSDPIVVHA